ncbi:MAG: hypothetical protein JWM90_2378 [Thermoleophilia bacterium]|nr:hypothetical protein [Thermoleophilia bacterium]
MPRAVPRGGYAPRMLIAAPHHAPVSAALPAPQATLHYTMRAQGGGTKTTEIEAFIADGAPTVTVRGSFEDALRAARLVAAEPVMDGMHLQPVNQAQAISTAADGAWLVAPLSGLHRDAIGPIFVDGPFYRRAGLAVWAERTPNLAAATLQAIVGVDSFADLRSSRPASGMEPLPA